MKPAMSMYSSLAELYRAKEAYEAGERAAILGASRDQKPDRFGDEWFWGFDNVKEI